MAKRRARAVALEYASAGHFPPPAIRRTGEFQDAVILARFRQLRTRSALRYFGQGAKDLLLGIINVLEGVGEQLFETLCFCCWHGRFSY